MGDWSDNLEYEQREYYGNFYIPDLWEEPEEETDGLIAKQKVLATLEFADNALDEERTVENYKELVAECIKVLSSDSKNPNKCFDGMTNGDVIDQLFGKDVYYNLIKMMYSSCCEKLKKWWDAPYQKGGEE